jgi:hypothetical protein
MINFINFKLVVDDYSIKLVNNNNKVYRDKY